jgi:hypothetical protein
MRHWDAVLPGRVHRVIYEDLIEDLEGSVRQALTYCGLDFEQSCLDFHQNSRSVATASSEQVRTPLNRQGLDAWLPYRPWLRPLELGLGDASATYRT